MSVCGPPLLVPMSGDFKSAGADDCETRAATLPTSPHSLPRSLTIQLLIFPSLTEVKPTEQKAQWVSSAWTALILLLFVPMFHVSSFSEGAKQSFSARSHPTMPCTATNENAAFSQQFPQWQLFFPCSPFREPIWGTEAIKPAENEKKNNSLRSQETKYSIQWTQSLTTQLFLISLMSLYQSLRNYVFSTAFSQHPSLFVWLYTKVLHDVSCVFRNNELIEKLSVCIYSSFCDQCVGVNGQALRQTYNLLLRITAVSMKETYHFCSQYLMTQGSTRNTALGQRAASQP